MLYFSIVLAIKFLPCDRPKGTLLAGYKVPIHSTKITTELDEMHTVLCSKKLANIPKFGLLFLNTIAILYCHNRVPHYRALFIVQRSSVKSK